MDGSKRANGSDLEPSTLIRWRVDKEASMKAIRLLTVLAVVILMVPACGEGEAVDDATTSSSSIAPTTTEATTTTTQAATTTEPPTTTTEPATTTSTMPGEPFDIFPPAGAVLGVIGVEHNDVLNVRSLPGTTTIVTTLAPLEDNVVSAGEGRKLPTTIWWKVTANGGTGWVNSSYVAYLGGVTDVTSQVVAAIGSYPTAASMEELGMEVAETLASTDPASTIVMSAAPSGGDVPEVTYDVIGLGDDAQRGWRLHVFGTVESGGFSLKTVEATTLCGRGLSGELCV
jgi:uncharacterized protein YraI